MADFAWQFQEFMFEQSAKYWSAIIIEMDRLYAERDAAK